MAKILIVDDEIGIRELLSEILSDEGHDVVLAENASGARAARNATKPDLVLLDIWMPDTDGITLLKEWSASGQLTMPVVMMSGHGTIDTAVEATRIGAIDYLEKPIALQKLLASVKRGLQRPPVASGLAPLTLSTFSRSAPLRELKRRIVQLADNSRTILLRSAAGSLAELIARSVNETGLPWLDISVMNSAMDASHLQASSGGILFVEEISQLNRTQQGNVVFALERLERYDLHLVMATDQDFESLKRLGWNENLLNRLFQVCLTPPTMTDLRDDIPEIATRILLHMVEGGEVPLRRFSTGALNHLRALSWTGGYMELRSVIKSLALASLEEEISLAEVRRQCPVTETPHFTIQLDQPLREAREAFERLYFEHHLRLENGNMTRLAEKTGLERTHLYRKLKQLGLQAGRRHENH